MATLMIGDGIQSALSHFAMYGLALLCEEKWPGKARMRWTNEEKPLGELSVPDVTEEAIAELLLEYATHLAAPDAWPQVRHTYGAKKKAVELSPMSPRIRAMDPIADSGDWREHQKLRHRAIDVCFESADYASLQWIAALGEAAYWRCDGKSNRPDEGASRWEMKTRNRGEEFVKDRLSPMVKELSQWDVSRIFAGITGRSVDDTIGKQKVDSRTSTGLTSPAPTDVALAFAGLLGIAAFPLVHNSGGISVTPGAWHRTRLHPSRMILPVPTEPMSLARLRSILMSGELALVTDNIGSILEGTSNTAQNSLEVKAAMQWLRLRGVTVITVFPILKTGSSTAPERQVQRGELWQL
ncbi:hypothetical protein [Corynebacterium freiburgense]|uniref:hypothetical protein n=1 Tax=Corynebacterium freiburgense TaxID=556548 RepID=UPI0003FCE26A|nr:hypothetical protein [Corynebacterium freiburgense]WJZ03455.1 hypothetical protein CFREI_10925 [Corynebacterium freiburgense]